VIQLCAATGNPGKLREFRLAAKNSPCIEIGLLPGFPQIPPCPETGSTFEENAIAKARYYAPYSPGLLFADDSGLEVDALGGAPGIYSARFSGPDATDTANNGLLLEKLHGISHRTARFVCVIALVEGNRVQETFRGTVDGVIALEPQGTSGFGYDPLFYYPPLGCTFGELAAEQKLAVSHRGHALQAMLEWLSRT
jgi:XTP/dITP diphosphohydrolase